VRLETRKARRRRTVALELLTEEGTQPPAFTLAARISENPEAVAARAREWLGVSLEQQARFGDDGGLSTWIGALENRGVLVFQSERAPVSEMRAFSMFFDALPVVVLNGADAAKARVFSLMHELAHLMLRHSGVCDPEAVPRAGSSADDKVEIFCNAVAGSLLVPSNVLQEALQGAADEESIHALSRRFSVSKEVVLRRLLFLRVISLEFYREKRDEYARAYEEYAARQKEKAKVKPPFIPVFRRVLKANGRQYTRIVMHALDAQNITEADVTDYLGVKLQHLDDIAQVIQNKHVEVES